MVWVKAEIDSELNQAVETVQEQYQLSKPEAVALLVEWGVEDRKTLGEQ
jgi:hypothetical protein